MSIGLYIGYQTPEKEDRLVPIASDAVFEKFWKPLCVQLRLRWVSRFQKGWSLASCDMEPILNELALLRRYLAETEPNADIAHQMLSRIGVLMRELNEIQKNSDLHAFIGGAFPAQRGFSSFSHNESRTEFSFFLPIAARRPTLPF